MFRIFSIIPLIVVFLGHSLYSQNVYDARNGSSLSPKARMRILTLCVNIIYDQTPERDPYYKTATPQWEPGNPGRLNDHPPLWLSKFLDADLTNAPKGTMTRYFYESSLGNLIILGDFAVVNLLQSKITPDKPGENFNFSTVVSKAIEQLNALGGFKGIYGFDSIGDFDMISKGTPGLPKSNVGNGKIDFVMVFTRNTVRKEQGGRVLYNYGQNNPGEGYSYESNACKNCNILIGDTYYENEITTVQSVGTADYSQSYRNIAFHEFAHNLFGSNAFHSAGGNHFGTSNAAVFMGLQGGYGLMGGYNSSLVSCNAYDRWRLGWMDTIENPNRYEVCASGKKSNIGQSDGAQEFYLRDFVTTGDAIRIEMPFVDPGAEKQYLWLENHQVGKNGKLDFLQFSNEDNCRQPGSAGVYVYIQVGRDKLTADKAGGVFSGDETDNLRFLTSKGNWDMRIDKMYDTLTCIAWKAVKPAESYWKPNPFTGYTDLQTHIWDTTGKALKLDDQDLCSFPYRITGQPELPYLGDNYSAFTGHALLDVSTNPAPFNAITHYTVQYNQKFTDYPHRVNNVTTYVTGLQISMDDMGDGSFKVVVRWDQHELKGKVRWTGNIDLKGDLTLSRGSLLLLDQGYTPVQITRDTASGTFAPLTQFSCEEGSTLQVQSGAALTLDHGSSLIVKAGARLKLLKDARIIVGTNASLIIAPGAVVENEGAKIKIRNGGKVVGL